MDINKILKAKLQEIPKDKLIKQMGYNSLKKGSQTLEIFQAHDNLYSWIYSGHYDLKYTATQFFEKLCEALGIEKKDVEYELQELQKYKDELDRFKNSYIFINTNFQRKSEPIFALAMMESQRYIKIDASRLVFKNDEEIFHEIVKIVQTHFKESDKKAGIWGDIVNYVYHHTDSQTYIFDVDGNRIEGEEVLEQRATLSLGGKEIFKRTQV